MNKNQEPASSDVITERTGASQEWYDRQRILNDVLKSVMNLTDNQVAAIIEMVQDHGHAVIDEARDYVKGGTHIWTFEAFVIGAKIAVIDRLRGRMSDGMILALGDIEPDGLRYGSVRWYGKCDQDVAELFMDMCVDGVVEERIGELISYDVELYGGCQDEPEDDVDMDRLLDGLANMMEGHGIRGDVRAKAKEFLAAVAADTLDAVIREE